MSPDKNTLRWGQNPSRASERRPQSRRELRRSQRLFHTTITASSLGLGPPMVSTLLMQSRQST